MAAIRPDIYRINRSSGARVSDIQASAREAWRQLHTPGTVVYERAIRDGFDPKAFPTDLDELLTMRPERAGIGSLETVAILFLSEVARDLWRRVIRPEIEARWGRRALTAKSADKNLVSARKGSRAKKSSSKKRN